jgi:hypothetical protein
MLGYRKISTHGCKATVNAIKENPKNSALENLRTTEIKVSLPFNIKNPDSALASIKIGNSLFFNQNNDLMDLVVVLEHESTSKKNHAEIAEESLKLGEDPESSPEEDEEATS